MTEIERPTSFTIRTRNRNTLDKVLAEIESSRPFDQKQHDSESRKEITKLFLKWYFCLIAAAFVFSALYNFIAALLNALLIQEAALSQMPAPESIVYLDVSNTVSIITTTLSSGVGFVIGYYFKNKGDS